MMWKKTRFSGSALVVAAAVMQLSKEVMNCDEDGGL